MKYTIGLLHPSSVWHRDSDELRGMEIEVVLIREATYLKGTDVEGQHWYTGVVKLINPPSDWNCVANSLSLDGFRPRRVK